MVNLASERFSKFPVARRFRKKRKLWWPRQKRRAWYI